MFYMGAVVLEMWGAELATSLVFGTGLREKVTRFTLALSVIDWTCSSTLRHQLSQRRR